MPDPTRILTRIAEMMDCEPDDLSEAVAEMVEDRAAQSQTDASRQAHITRQQHLDDMRVRHAAEMATMQARLDEVMKEGTEHRLRPS